MKWAHRKPLRHLFRVLSGATPKTNAPSHWDGEILWATPEDVTSLSLDEYWLLKTQRTITSEGYESCGTTIAPPGSIVLTKRAPIGRVALLARDACTNQGCFLLVPCEEADTRFYYYWLLSQTQQLEALGQGSTFTELSGDDLKSLSVPYPRYREQLAISNYLDHETAQLAALLYTKERVLHLLAEKRQVLVSRAVTRGLDCRAEVRESRIPWLGEIPSHWDIWKLGHIATIGNGSTPSRSNAAYWASGTIPWLNSSVVGQHQVKEATQFVTDVALRECHLPLVKKGSVLVAITGQGKTRGTATVLSLDATINQHLAYISPVSTLVVPWFLRWTLLAAYEHLRSISDDMGGTKGALTCENLANLKVAVPPIEEQHQIVTHIADKICKLDGLLALIKKSTALLKEHRAALISKAVSGKLDLDRAA